MEKCTFHIITPVYNAEKWIGSCIDSVKNQTYGNFRQVIVDDFSTDNTVAAAKEAIGEDTRITLITKKEKKGTMHGHILAMEHEYEDTSIMVHLDGDDWFSDSNVLDRLNGIYQDKDIWVTYGSYKTTDGTPQFCRAIPNFQIGNTYVKGEDLPIRSSNSPSYLGGAWIFSQIRSFRSFLCKGLSYNDFVADDKDYFLIADCAVFVPILEMAGLKRVKYVPEIQMIYNRENPLNDDKVNRDKAILHNTYLRSRESKDLWNKPNYDKVEVLWKK